MTSPIDHAYELGASSASFLLGAPKIAMLRPSGAARAVKTVTPKPVVPKSTPKAPAAATASVPTPKVDDVTTRAVGAVPAAEHAMGTVNSAAAATPKRVVAHYEVTDEGLKIAGALSLATKLVTPLKGVATRAASKLSGKGVGTAAAATGVGAVAGEAGKSLG